MPAPTAQEPHSYNDDATWNAAEIMFYLGCGYIYATEVMKKIPSFRYGRNYKAFAKDVKIFAQAEMKRQCGL